MYGILAHSILHVVALAGLPLSITPMEEPVAVRVSRREVRVVFPRDTSRTWGWAARTAPGYGPPYVWTMTVDGMDGPRTLAISVQRTETEVTPIGRALRATHLDEIPQLWNVLRGDMSMVGPRPIRPPFFAELCEHIPQYWQRLVIRPGVTGFAQTRMTREESWADKLAHDMEYIADRSVGLYFHMLLATVS